MKELYKKEICINCANENCTNKIEEIKQLDLCVDQMSTKTIIKCKDFIPKNKRKKASFAWQQW